MHDERIRVASIAPMETRLVTLVPEAGHVDGAATRERSRDAHARGYEWARRDRARAPTACARMPTQVVQLGDANSLLCGREGYMQDVAIAQAREYLAVAVDERQRHGPSGAFVPP